jgi:hypothetical protein
MDMALGESVLDDAAQRPRVFSLDHVALILALFSTGDLRIVEVLFEKDRGVVVNLSCLDVELAMGILLMAMIESILSWVLLHTRITPIEGEVGKVVRGHLDCSEDRRKRPGG